MTPDLVILVLLTCMVLLWYSSPVETLVWYFILTEQVYPSLEYRDLWWAFFLWYLVIVLFARRFIPNSLKVI